MFILYYLRSYYSLILLNCGHAHTAAMPLHMLYRGNAATCAISRQCRLWMQCRFMCYIWRQCRNVFHIWRQCRDMAAMPRHGGNAATWRQCRDTYCILYIAAMPRQMIDAVMSMHACTHVHMFCDFYAHTKSQTPLPLESQPRAYVVEKLNNFETCLQRKIL